MSGHLPPATSEELLVAYLDGELDEPSRARLEQQLAQDTELQAQVASLQRSWEALDWLPRDTMNPEFAASTISLVAATAEAEEPKVQRPWFQQHAFAARIIAGLLLATAVGFLAFAAPRYWLEQRRLQDLPMLTNLDGYRAAGTLEFLRELAKKRATVHAHPLGSDSVDPQRFSRSLALARSRKQIQSALSGLTTDEIDALQMKSERFARFPVDERDQLRALHQAVVAEPNAESLIAVMSEYYDWLGTLPAEDRDALKELPTHDRLAKIDVLEQSQVALRRRPFWNELQQPANRQHLLRWTAEFLEAHRAEILDKLPPQTQSRWHQARPRRPLVYLLLVENTDFGRSLPEPTREEIEQLLAGLTPELGEELGRQIEERGPQVIWRIRQQLAREERNRRLSDPYRGPPGPPGPHDRRPRPPGESPPFPPPQGDQGPRPPGRRPV